MKESRLNPTIAAYVEESNAHDIGALTARFKTDAVVADEGLTRRGAEEIRHWIEKTHSEYRFTLEALDFAEEGGETIVTCLVAGTFPGSPVRLRFHFTLDGDKIAALTIRG
jgi:ketosteroid isomerase-like protein